MGIEQIELKGRTERLRRRMREEGYDALLIYSDEYRSGHSTYVTNYKPINVIEESPQLVLLVGEAPPSVLMGRLNAYAAREITWIEDVRSIHRIDEFLPEVLKPIRDRSSRVALIGHNLMPVKYYDQIKAAIPRASIDSRDDLIIELRQIKSPAEIRLMARAAELNDQVLREVLRRCKVGMTEIQIAGIAEGAARELGADIGSATVVMAGSNTNYPAWRPSGKKVEPGDFLLVDMNPAVDHYCNDGGITVLMHGAETEQVRALTAGHRIFKEVIPLLKPRTNANTIFNLMLERLEPLGYAKNFTPYAKGMRGVGHGVGIDVVEPPNLSSDSDFLLLPGMTLAVKLDLHGFKTGGYRIEVVVAFTESGVEPLNKLVLQEPDTLAVLN